jgi:hypothetical protein
MAKLEARRREIGSEGSKIEKAIQRQGRRQAGLRYALKDFSEEMAQRMEALRLAVMP